MTSEFHAHTLGFGPEERQRWEPLRSHLERVAAIAERSAAEFGAGPLGFLAGLWHDLGKYQPAFQRRLYGEAIRVEHAGVGAALAAAMGVPEGTAIAFAIAGHHAGLANFRSSESAMQEGFAGSPRRSLAERLAPNSATLDSLREIIPAELLGAGMHASEAISLAGEGDQPIQRRRFELLTRFLFSALVDADRLATAAAYATVNGSVTHDLVETDPLPVLLKRLCALQSGMGSSSPVDALRREILDACVAAAEHAPGRFSLTAPTGGGKTLSAMRFALEHAVRQGLRRVIVVIPYTSIIEQNARVYRDVFGARNVLEHHSNLDEERLRDEDSEQEALRKLAAENWDCPIVVTTSVQFLESLFSDHPSRCRKLHNIARSVVILDEVQTLPPVLLHPILDVLGELTGPRIGCSLVLSTATPPALMRRDELPFGLTDVRPILPNAGDLATRARRVEVTWEVGQPASYDELGARLAGHERVLAIVHRRQDAKELAEAVARASGIEGLFHLSALMCPAHRLEVLHVVGERLRGEGACRVVSTQLVEAGVDLDFPLVYRALAGLDSLAQAAGRCDREGRLTEANRAGGRDQPGGRLVVFEAPTPPPKGVPKIAMQTMRKLLVNRGQVDIFDPAVCERYFALLYADTAGGERIQLHRENLDFMTTAWCFRMIESAAKPVAVPWGDGAERIRRFREEPTRSTQRALQPFLVQVNRFHLDALRAAGVVETVHDRVDVLLEHHRSRYDERFGLDPRADGVADPEVLSM